MTAFAKSGYRGGAVPFDASDHSCAAMGCKVIASVRLESGPWLCTAHAFISRDIWQITTDRLLENNWLVDFIAEMQDMQNKHQDWRRFAIEFWSNDQDGAPHPDEGHLPYVNRMRGELLFRCGQYSKRPTVKPLAKFLK